MEILKNSNKLKRETTLRKKAGGEEKMAELRKTLRDLEQQRPAVGCVSEAADGFIISVVNSGWSHIEIKSSLGVSSVRMGRIAAEIKNQPCDLRNCNHILLVMLLVMLLQKSCV
jgi:hypothetical protein